MKKLHANILNLGFLFTLALSAKARADNQQSISMLGGHHNNGVSEVPKPMGFSLTEGWLDPWPHNHFSPGGTPFVHGFGIEPAYLDRDLFFDLTFIKGKDGREIETEIELEWALTRRLGVVFEVPYIQSNPDVGATQSGFGDIAIAPRALLYESERLILSLNLELGLPTGSERKGFGGEEVRWAPSISTWFDLGHRTTFMTQIGFETGVESGDSEFFYSGALTHTLFTSADNSRRDLAHFPAGMVNFITEFTGRTGLHGSEDGESSSELLFGLSYLLSSNWEIRGAYQIPVSGDSDFEEAVKFGVIYHF